MQFIKQFGKQLAFVVLMGSSVFSVSSAIAQVPPRTTYRIFVNSDYIIDSNILKSDFPGATQLFLKEIGGLFQVNPTGGRVNVNFVDTFYDTFNTFAVGYNNQIVGTSRRNAAFDPASNGGPFAVGSFNEIRDTVVLSFGLDSSSVNPPALAYNGTTCKSSNGCVRFHYGYSEDVIASLTQKPSFKGSFIKIRNLEGSSEGYYPFVMASPKLESIVNGNIEEYVVTYCEQTDPQQPDVVVANWTQFPVAPGAEPKLSFSNDESNSSSVIVSNTRVLRSATPIPLDQLTTEGLPPTDPGFVPVPEANGTIGSGETKPPVVVPPSGFTDIIRVLNSIVSFNGTSDFREIPNNENLNFGTGDLSISAWVKTTSTSGIEVILDKRVETTGPIQGYSLVNFNGSLLLQLADGVGNQFTNYVSNISIADGNWHHVAVSVDRNQPDGGRWYLDGVEIVGERFNPTRRGSLSNSKPLVIGRRSDNPGSPGFFKGEIGRVLLVKRVLSPQEIQALAANKP